MNIEPLLVFLAAPVLSLAIVLAVARRRRIPMERRARALLAEYPNAQQRSVYLAFRSAWPKGKQKEMDDKIAEMATAGWIFLRGTAASPLRTIRSWGGGVTLHFIRGDA